VFNNLVGISWYRPVLRREETIQRELSLIPRVMMRHGGRYKASDSFLAQKKGLQDSVT